MYCGFPKRFNSDIAHEGEDDIRPGSVHELLTKLWNGSAKVYLDKTDSLIFVPQSNEYSGTVRLPKDLPESVLCENVLVEYIQAILNLNGFEEMIVILDHSKDRDFEILTEEELLAKFKYPITEYRAEICEDGTSIVHPNITYTWIWMDREKAKKYVQVGDRDEWEK
jgi:hypothetical protein